MQLNLIRHYHPTGTNGYLYHNNVLLCHTIELPWKNNALRISCIPEGSYTVVKRYSNKFKRHLHLIDVIGRELILFHPANNALAELKGCIAPVMQHTGPGTGIRSREAMNCLMLAVTSCFKISVSISLTISACPERCYLNQHESDHTTRKITDTQLLP